MQLPRQPPETASQASRCADINFRINPVCFRSPHAQQRPKWNTCLHADREGKCTQSKQVADIWDSNFKLAVSIENINS